MKLWIISDLHLPRTKLNNVHIPDADVCVVAGDVCEGVQEAIAWLQHAIAPYMPVVYVIGNNELYGEYIYAALNAARATLVPNLHLLADGVAMIDGVRFIGCTLWTDYRLFAHGERDRQREAMRTIRERLSDHRQIWVDPEAPGVIARHFEPRDALELHRLSAAFVEDQMTVPFDGTTVVVTHHAPHPMSIAPRWADDALTPAFVSDLSSLIDRGQPDIWIHGHTHASFDYTLEPLDGRPTRVICNPRGYGDGENPAFDWSMVVEV